jgi:hypothetical protein
MKSLFVFGVIAVIVTAIQGYSEDDHWKDFKVKLYNNLSVKLKLKSIMILYITDETP